MLDTQDADLTLPAVVASGKGGYQSQQLTLTIVFHPDSSRIGQSAVVTQQRGTTPWVLGRYSPRFSRGGEAAAALEDPHVSRRALRLIYDKQQLTVRRFDGASRCRFGQRELLDQVELATDQLRDGIPLLLGHSIVLLLRLGPRPVVAPCDPDCEDLLRGGSARMAALRDELLRAAGSNLDVLILGETGTGKELAATAIHRHSARAQRPLVSVNMAAIPTELSSAALFGREKGAYTGADKAAPGYFQQAEGGTLFLDEIGDASPQLQPQLLRALQQREIQSVGGAISRVDVRVISATDAALDDEAVDFKAALRYRLGACELTVPALREHPEDIGELLRHFLQQHSCSTSVPQVLPNEESPALDIAIWANFFFQLASYRWPGNVRELANVAQQVALAAANCEDLNNALQSILARHMPRQSVAGSADRASSRRQRSLLQVDDATFDAAMNANGFEVLLVAQQLGVSRAAIYRRIEASPHYRLVNAIDQEELTQSLASHDGDSVATARALRVSHNSLRRRLAKLPVDWH